MSSAFGVRALETTSPRSCRFSVPRNLQRECPQEFRIGNMFALRWHRLRPVGPVCTLETPASSNELWLSRHMAVRTPKRMIAGWF